MAGEIKIIDNATPWLKGMAAGAPDWSRKALKSAGWMMQQEIKKGIRSGAPGGSKYITGMATKHRRALDEVVKNRWNNPFENTQRKSKRSYKPIGRMVNAVGYKYQGPDRGVVVGWLSRSAVRIGTWLEKGTDQVVTPEMRRLFYGAGIGIKKGTIQIPARPTFAPMHAVLEPKVMPWVEAKIIEYANSGAPITRGGGGRYKVY